MSQPDARPDTGRSLWRRPLTLALLALGALTAWVVTAGVILALTAGQSAWAMGRAATAATSGDPTAAAAALETARAGTRVFRQTLDSPPLSGLRAVPYLETNLRGIDTVLAASDDLYDAAQSGNTVYARLMGSAGTGPAAFDNGTINVAPLQVVEPDLARLAGELGDAEQALGSVPGDLAPPLRELVDSARDQLAGVRKGLGIYAKVEPDLPQLLGYDGPAEYLVVFHNPGELYAGGGAALSAAVLRFDEGVMDITDKGAVSTHFFPGNPRVAWDPAADGPYYPEKGAKDGFAWSNLHQDYRVAGEDLARSWVANGREPVDGVISLDPVALQSAVAATGPIDSQLYGQITDENLIRKLLYEGYNEDPASQQRRHEVNQELVDEMLARMNSGPDALQIGRAVLATAPSHHVRIHLRGDRLADPLHQAQIDGAQPDPRPDRIAFYTQNQNASKVDIFQSRRVVHDVRLAPDGSAQVRQTATVTNSAPDNGTPLDQRISYTTRWAFHWNVVWLPEGAQDVAITANDGEIRVDDRTFTDVDGRTAVRVGRWLPPGESSVITTTYRLPDGTFGSGGNLKYRASVEHQLLVGGVDLTVNVTGPSVPTPSEGDWDVDGNRATSSFTVGEPTYLSLEYTP